MVNAALSFNKKSHKIKHKFNENKFVLPYQVVHMTDGLKIHARRFKYRPLETRSQTVVIGLSKYLN